MNWQGLLGLGVLCLLEGVAGAADPCVSGLTPGQRVGPYTAVICTGGQRGQLHCYICENADRPAVVVFARTLSEPLGKLVSRLDKAVVDHKGVSLNAWVTFLATDQSALDPQVVAWGKRHSISGVPLGVFEDVVGPPTYRLGRDADVTVLLFVNRKVVANFAWRGDELKDERINELFQALPRILPAKK